MFRHQYTRLCCLIDNSLHPYTAKLTESITKEQEKSLLIVLSQVLNQLKLWIAEMGSDSDNGNHGNPSNDVSICHSSNSECIFKIINELVFLLSSQSPYARHLAGNVLVAISEFVITSENYWEDFITSLCFHFQVIIHTVISPSSNPPKPKYLDHDLSTSNLNFQSLSNDAKLHSASSIVLVLRNILKKLKNEDDDEILEVYMNALNSSFKTIQWESCNEISIEFCGHLLQLFCSLVSDSEDKNPLIQEIFNIFPRFLTCYQSQEDVICISKYIRHKILVLMIRLSSIIELDCEMVVSWLDLIDRHFKNLLYESLSQPDCGQDDCLKDSPFLLIESSHQHLQRRVVFLFLKCGFRLIGLKEKTTNQCVCGDVKSCSKKGFMAIQDWLKKHLLNSHRFSKSFLQLYIHEDDMLFEVLLLLTDMPFYHDQRNNLTVEVVEKDILILLSDVFDPVHLFHLFLSELHYDHQVLLDYLISKHTGSTCAQYLLRCLRIICDKWDSFLKFPSQKESESQSLYKRRKVINHLSETDHNNQNTCKEPFQNAMNCLLLLKKSIESLHQKDLFPYNPKVLLRRLTRFQELCPRS